MLLSNICTSLVPPTLPSVVESARESTRSGNQGRSKKLASFWRVLVPRGGTGCKGSFPASRRVGQILALFSCDLLFARWIQQSCDWRLGSWIDRYRCWKTDQRATNHLFSGSREASVGGSVFGMFHLDYLFCFLTLLGTMLRARKSWLGLLFAIVNSLIVCAIGLRTSQLGFIPANLFCICVYAFSMRPWLKEQTYTKSRSRAPRSSGSAAQNQEQPAVLRKRPAVRKAVLQDVPAVD